jgi:hypothetical protein
VTTSTIRFVLIAALVVGGIVIINQAFPEGASAGGGGVPPAADGGGTGATDGTGSTNAPTGGSGPTGGTTGQPADVPSPQVQGVFIAVFNTTGVSGLATDVNDQLEAEGYVAAQDPADAPSSEATNIYFRSPNDQADAEHIANTIFKKIDVVPTKLQPGNDLDREVQVAIYIGNDYAALQTG